MPGPDSSVGFATRDLLRRARRRHLLISVAYSAAIGLAIAMAMLLLLPLPPAMRIGAGAIVFAAGVVIAFGYAKRLHVAQLVERRAPQCRNLLITAEELMQDPRRGGSTRDVVFAQADRAAKALDIPKLFPTTRALGTLTTAGIAYAAAVAALANDAPADSTALKANTAARIHDIEIVVSPPAYTGLKPDTLRDPARIEARAGSTVHVFVRADADSVHMETVDGRSALEREGHGFGGSLVTTADGFIALHATATGDAAVTRLVGLAVTQDAPPRVRITAPGRDLFLAQAPAALDITLEAEDDLGLGTLSLHFTRVSGSGEQFEFTDGSVPLRVDRTSAVSWTARGVLPLDTLRLAAGDMIVYRGVATDRRPGAPPVESDTYILEIAGPGALAAGGFTTDDEHDRYAISQQMLILETERLQQRQPSITAEALKEQALRLASLQRQVRAEFVFMMGGELEDDVGMEAGIMELNEHEEAEAEDDILAGRLANRGRVELLRAIREMSRASAALTETNLPVALEHERSALGYLQRAFSRTRYILRTLSERERLDLSRRLTGTLADAGRDVRPVTEPERDTRVGALRAVLSTIAELAAQPETDADATGRVAALAQQVLRIDASAEPLQSLASQLAEAADAISAGRSDLARTSLERAALETAQLIRAALPPAPAHTAPLEQRILEGALVDALRRQVRR